MGIYRLILSYFVVLAHLDVALVNPLGKFAVVSFLIMSGYVTTLMI